MERRKTRQIQVGKVKIGGDAPISVQSMTNTRTDDAAATLRQIGELAAAGCEIIRCAVPDMQAAVNYILEKFGYPTRTLEEVRRFVGNGAGPLIHRALPQGVDPDREAEILADYRAYYQAHNCVETRPYDGIGPLLERLRQEIQIGRAHV